MKGDPKLKNFYDFTIPVGINSSEEYKKTK